MGAVLGIGRNPLVPVVAEALEDAASRLGVRSRVLDLPSLRVEVPGNGAARVFDRDGPVEVHHLAPALLYWYEAAADAYLALEVAGVATLNPVAASELADDKARTALRLAAAGVAQVRTWVVAQDAAACAEVAAEVGYPVVLKRTHGAQGRWVRVLHDAAALAPALEELAREGRGALVVQPFVEEAAGRSLRVICTAGEAVAATERLAPPGDVRSNISGGGSQLAVPLAAEEERLAVAATAALGLGHAGVDLLRTAAGPAVLEVNACPDFTSMLAHVGVDIAAAVVQASSRAIVARGRADGPRRGPRRSA